MAGRAEIERKRLRLREYDYSQPGAYFVTICTRDKANLFGEIMGEEMRLNMVGQIAERCWKDLPEHFGNIELDQFVVMPNHFHGIIIILDNPVGATSRRPVNRIVSSPNGAGRPRPYQRPTLGQMVAYFKYQSAKRINASKCSPGVAFWQRGYYDRIIRNDRSLTRIREYIARNPQRWGTDKENSAYEENDEGEGWMASNGENHFQGATR